MQPPVIRHTSLASDDLDAIIEYHALNGEMGAVGELLQAHATDSFVTEEVAPDTDAVASQVAANLFNLLPFIMTLPASQAFSRIKMFFVIAITSTAQRAVRPDPSENCHE